MFYTITCSILYSGWVINSQQAVKPDTILTCVIERAATSIDTY